MKHVLFVLAALSAATSFALLEPVSPINGETVEQLWPNVRDFLKLPREARQANRFKINKEQRAEFARNRGAKPVRFTWKGATNGVYRLQVKRVPDGRVFAAATVTGCTWEVTGRLEIAREWKWSVSCGKEKTEASFRTDGQAPRIIALDGVANARDAGGWIGLGGRRVKQGLVIRTGGLNHNAKIEYYSYDEILELFKAGKLQDAGVGLNAKHLAHKYAAQLKKDGGRGNGIDRNFLRLIKTAPKEPGAERLSAADRDFLVNFIGIKSDLDLRGDWETFGMLFSPLGKDVTWCHCETRAGYGSFTTPVGRACQAQNIAVLVGKHGLPVDCHCIGGTDRTGTFVYLLNGFLGVSEEDLIRDYEMSFISGGGVDKRHYGWLMSLVKAVRELPGETIADKIYGYYLSLGFTREQLDQLRETLLERAK